MNMKEELKAFVDNELSEQDRTRILREIENSPELQAEVIELRQMSRMIQEEAWQPEPVGLERTLGALASGGKRTPWWMGRPMQLVGALGCLVIFAAIMFPVFAQPKAASRKTWEMNQSKREATSVPGGHPNVSSDYPAFSAPAEEKGKFSPQVEAGWSGSGFKDNVVDAQFRERDSNAGLSKGANARSKPVAGEATSSQAPAVDLGSLPAPRLEIKTANLSVEVIDVPKAQQEAEAITKGVNGRVQSSQKSDDEGRLASAELTLRVPVRAFETTVNRLRKLGRVLNDSISGEDVTAQVADTEARLKVMRAEEDQYIELLRSTKKVGEVLSVKERLSQVRQEIESLEANRKVLRSQAAESTIYLSLTQKPSEIHPRQDPEWSEDAWSRAVSSLGAVGRFLGKVVVYLFVFSPIWLPIVGLAWWMNRRNRR